MKNVINPLPNPVSNSKVDPIPLNSCWRGFGWEVVGWEVVGCGALGGGVVGFDIVGFGVVGWGVIGWGFNDGLLYTISL